jgi:hypothetical protein
VICKTYATPLLLSVTGDHQAFSIQAVETLYPVDDKESGLVRTSEWYYDKFQRV